MTGGEREHRRRARLSLASLRSPVIASLVALVLLVQLFALPYHRALSAPAAGSAVDVVSVAATLKATFGEAAALCVESDDKGGPAAPGGDCDDHCPLCRFAAEAGAFVAPDAPPLPVRFDHAHAVIDAQPDASAPPTRPAEQSRARAPPLAV